MHSFILSFTQFNSQLHMQSVKHQKKKNHNNINIAHKLLIIPIIQEDKRNTHTHTQYCHNQRKCTPRHRETQREKETFVQLIWLRAFPANSEINDLRTQTQTIL